MKRTALLLGAASALALATSASAAEFLFGGRGTVQPGQQISTSGQTTQILLDNGATLSLVGDAVFSIRDDGGIDIQSGGVTVSGGTGAETLIHLADGSRISVTGSTSLDIDAQGARANVISGRMDVSSGGNTTRFDQGESWEVALGGAPRQVAANGPQKTPGGVQNQTTGGAAAAAQNGVPVNLGVALGAVGAGADVVAAAERIEAAVGNPAIRQLPSGDVALLVEFASELAATLGGEALFDGASPAIIDIYLGYLADGGQIAEFQAAYSAIVLQYLNLLATGAASGDFDGLDLAALNTYFDYLESVGGLAQYTENQQAVVQAYLDFLASGGLPDAFTVPGNLLPQEVIEAYVDLIDQYVAFLQGGGDPADFTGGAPALVAQYLAVLESSGLLNTLLAEQADALRDYLAFVQGGGDPGDFDGFGISDELAQQYAAAIEAFIAYIEAGNLPSEYGVFNAAVFQAYLQALADAGVLADYFDGDNADFLAEYLAYLAGGGAFDDFAGLPDPVTDEQKLAALDAFLAFVNGGGLPSDFDGESAQTLDGYFDDLGLTFAQQARLEQQAFLNAYFFHTLAAGKPGDSFPALAANGGSVRTVTTAYAYASNNGFADTFGKQPLAVLFDGDDLPFNGVPTNTSMVELPTGATFAQFFSNDDIMVGRIVDDGTSGYHTFRDGANQGLHYAFAPPAANTPTNTVLHYDLTFATSPTFIDGGTAPGVFDAEMAIGFNGSEIRVATEGSVTMPTDATYAFQTAGGLDGVEDLAVTTFHSFGVPFFQQGAIELSGEGRACQAGADCSLYMAVLPGGEGAEYLAVSYESRNGGDGAVPFQGAAAFTSTGTFVPGQGGGDVDPPTGAVRSDQFTVYTGVISGIDNRRPTDVTYDDVTGAPVAYQWMLNETTQGNENQNIGGATQHEAGSVAGILGWTRWAGGTSGGTYYSSNGVELAENGGEHLVSGEPVSNMPQSGTVQYALIGATKPTVRDGSVAPGAFTGDLAVAFGAEPHVGFEFDVAIGGSTYELNSPGGVADPTQGAAVTVSPGSRFDGFWAIPNLTATGAGPACGGSCTANVQGFLAGEGASHVGVAYTFGTGLSSSYVGGVAAFGPAAP